MPSGSHNGREVFYVFGRYPQPVKGVLEYPVTDLVVCHGSFLNADSEYVHKNKPVRGFGSYGDIMIRDRKMYVVPTPFFLAEGTTGLATLIVPDTFEVTDHDHDLVSVGVLERVEVDYIVTSYEFNLETNKMLSKKAPNPNAGKVHRFIAYRSRGRGDQTSVSLSGNLPTLDDDDE